MLEAQTSREEALNCDTKKRAMAYAGRRYEDQGQGFHSSDNSTTECIEKVEAMISTAILHQEDVWNMLLSLFPDKGSTESCTDQELGHGDTSVVRVAVESHIPEAVKEKLEKAMDWCRLAQFRLKGIILDNQPPASRNNGSQRWS